MVGAVVGEEPAAEARDGAGVVRAEILEEIRYPGERPDPAAPPASPHGPHHRAGTPPR